MEKLISIVLVDDTPPPQVGILALIRAQPDFRVLATLAEVEEVMRRVRDTKPDLVLLNLPHQGDDGLTLAGALHGAVPESRVIMMGMDASQEDVAVYVRAGVAGFIMADASFDTFLSTIRSVAEGIQVLPAELTAPLFGQLKRYGNGGRPVRTLDIHQLTGREREVADLIVLGLSNREIAARLDIALYTVKSHVHRVLSKLSIGSRLEVASLSQHQAAPVTAPL